jgi:hypothetical protein
MNLLQNKKIKNPRHILFFFLFFSVLCNKNHFEVNEKLKREDITFFYNKDTFIHIQRTFSGRLQKEEKFMFCVSFVI